MTELADQQQALLEALFAWPAQSAVQHVSGISTGAGSNPGRGLRAYQSNGHALAQRALAAAYPVLVQMLGSDSFADLARAYWHAQPPQRGDISQWGEDLYAFVRSSVQLQEEPYLPDVIQVEWALHRCASARNKEAQLASLALLTTEDPQTLTLDLAPGLFLGSSAWPVASIVLAHIQGNPTFAEVADAMRNGIAQDTVVWRAAYQPKLRAALAGERAMLQALQSGLAVEPALQLAPDLNFPEWLPLAVQTGLVLGVHHQAQPFKESQ